VNISEKIKKVIKDKAIKDSEFALSTGISIDRVRNLCQGKVKKLQPHEKDAIRDAYGVSQEWWESDSVNPYMLDVEPLRSPSATYAVSPARVPLNNSGAVKVELLQPSAEWIVLTTIAISEADWLPPSIKLDRSAQAGLALRLYQLLVMHLGTSEPKWEWMMNNREALQHVLHFVFDLDQMEILMSQSAQDVKKG
jgi:hypothetical protein